MKHDQVVKGVFTTHNKVQNLSLLLSLTVQLNFETKPM